MDDRTIIALLDEIERLSARVAALEGLVKLEEERSDALGDIQYRAGVKFGWNLGIDGNSKKMTAIMDGPADTASPLSELKRMAELRREIGDALHARTPERITRAHELLATEKEITG